MSAAGFFGTGLTDRLVAGVCAQDRAARFALMLIIGDRENGKSRKGHARSNDYP